MNNYSNKVSHNIESIGEDMKDMGEIEKMDNDGNKKGYLSKLSQSFEVNKPIMAIFFNYFNILAHERLNNGNLEVDGIIFRGILNQNNDINNIMPDSPPKVFTYTVLFTYEGNEIAFVLDSFYEGNGSIRNIIRITSLEITDMLSRDLYDKLFKLALDYSNLKGSYITVSDNSLNWKIRELKNLSFDDVFLPSQLKLDLKMYTELFKSRGILQRYMFSGIPGTGKTEITRAISKCLNNEGVTIIKTNICEIIKEKFELATILAPSIIILDDVDLYLGDRNRNGVSHLLGQFLDILDGVDKLPTNVGVIASTNAPHLIDLAAQRPGRFNKLLFFEELTKDNIKNIIKKSLDSMNSDFNNISDKDIAILTDESLINFFKKDGSTGAFIYETIKNIKHSQDILGGELDLPNIIAQLKSNNELISKKLMESTIKSKFSDNEPKIGYN